jgi:hypothetical protein
VNIYMTRSQARKYNRLCNQRVARYTDWHKDEVRRRCEQIRRQINHHVSVVRAVNKHRLVNRIRMVNAQRVLADLSHRELGMLLRKNPQIPECIPSCVRGEVLSLAADELERRRKERLDNPKGQQ